MDQTMKTSEGAPRPWHREPWPWLLMAGPALVVVAGFITLWLAVKSNDGLVAGDYYKRGLAINQVLSREREARDRHVRASVTMRADEGRVRVALSGDRLPGVLRLQIVHPTRSGLDRQITLARVATGVYEAPAAPLPPGRWRLTLEDGAGSWRLSGDWPGAGGAAVELAAVNGR